MKRTTPAIFKLASLIVLVSVLLGCATGSTVLTGTKRPPINPATVEVYLDAPSNYETIGMVDATSNIGISRQSAQNRLIGKLKSLAAKSGANALILVSTGSQSTGSSRSTSNKLTGQARAIFVLDDESKQ